MLRLQKSPAGLAAVVLRAHFTTTLSPSAKRFCRANSSTGVPCSSVTISITIRALLTGARYVRCSQSRRAPARLSANVVSRLCPEIAHSTALPNVCAMCIAVRSDDAVLSQLLHVLGADAAERAEQGVGVLAEQRWAAHRNGRVGQLDRAADRPI